MTEEENKRKQAIEAIVNRSYKVNGPVKTLLVFCAILAVSLLVSYTVFAAIVYALCLLFGFEFSFLLTLIMFIVFVLLRIWL